MVKYAPRTSTAAIAKAKSWVGKSYPPGWCQKWVVGEIFGTGGVGDWDGDRAADAEDGWKAAVKNGRVVHARDITQVNAIPAGVALYWTGGRNDHGHAAVSAGNGYIYSTDLPTNGRIGKVRLDEVRRRWGYTFVGYVTVTGNGYTLTDKPSGPVDKMDPANYYVGAKGDHVLWLGQRLVAHGTTNYTPTKDYTKADVKAVAAFQRKQGWSGAGADGLPGRETLKRLAADPPKASLPAQVIDLSRAKLTTPFGREDHPTEVKQPGLNRYADSRCFFVRERDDKRSVVFRVTGSGVTTKNSDYPRCELREMEDGDEADWNTSTADRLLEGLYHVTGNAKVVIQQIHDAKDDLVMVSWQNGAIVVEWSKGKGKGSTKKQVDTVGKDEWFHLAIEVKRGVVRVLLNGEEVDKRKKSTSGCYQKTAAYLQSSKSSAWAEVEIAENSLKMGRAA